MWLHPFVADEIQFAIFVHENLKTCIWKVTMGPKREHVTIITGWGAREEAEHVVHCFKGEIFDFHSSLETFWMSVFESLVAFLRFSYSVRACLQHLRKCVLEYSDQKILEKLVIFTIEVTKVDSHMDVVLLPNVGAVFQVVLNWKLPKKSS
jgi:hypothetical protein